MQGREPGFDLWGDDARFVQVFQVRLILGPEAGQFHADEILHRHETDTLEDSRRANFGNRLGIFRADFFSTENHVHCAPRRRLAGLDEHVNTRHVTILEAERLYSFGDGSEVFAADGDIDVFREASGIGLALFDVQIGSKAADYAVLESRRCEGMLYHLSECKKLLHACFEEGIDVRRHSSPGYHGMTPVTVWGYSME